jgi:hypothetical protein
MGGTMRGIVLAAFAAVLCLPGHAADGTKDVSPDVIIQKFAAKEAEFREARNNYTYRQKVKMQEMDAGGNPESGKWEETDDILFSGEGKRIEKVVFAPPISLNHLTLTPEDVQDLRNVQPFVLTTSEIGEYNISYLGREKVDEIGCYSFSVKPKKLVKGKRYFEGEIWVDDRDLQIVKTYGKGVGLLKKNEDNQFPRFETYREQIDGKYWFPTYTRADDVLHFRDNNQRVRMTVKYEDYKQFKSNATVTFGEEVKDPNQKEPEKK